MLIFRKIQIIDLFEEKLFIQVSQKSSKYISLFPICPVLFIRNEFSISFSILFSAIREPVDIYVTIEDKEIQIKSPEIDTFSIFSILSLILEIEKMKKTS